MRFKPSPKKILPRPLPFLKNRAILPPLEVYMVNSPSWPNLRLLAPPALVDCGGMTPLWHRETCLPVHRPPVPNQTKSDHAHPLPARCSRGGFPDLRNPESVSHFPPIKAKTPVIVHNQGISRQTPKNESPLFGQSTRWMGRTGIRQVKTCTKENSSPGGEDTGEGERHHQSVPFCASHRQSRQKPL